MQSHPLPTVPAPSTVLTADVAANGRPIPALDRIKLMSAADWEAFVLEWVYSLKSRYHTVEKCGGAGDMGRDVIGRATRESDPWDNYQCKHYDHPLYPSDIWVELAKLCYYTFKGEYSFPREYFFIAPQGVGNTLSKLLRNPNQLKQDLQNEWDEKCKTRIADTTEVPLDAALRAHIASLDFSRIKYLTPLTIIEQHRQTPHHIARFGGGLPSRESAPEPPGAVQAHETNYVRALLDAYEDRLKSLIASLNELKDEKLSEHLKRSRREFYSAEALREFSKDNVPPGTFDELLNEIQNGIADVVDAAHTDAVERVLAAVKQAKSLSLTSSALVSRINTSDKGGMCHQLANDQKVKWRK